MALRKHINPRSRTNADTGFGTSPASYGGRFINKDGSFNLEKQGWGFWKRVSIFNTLLTMPIWKFGATLVLFYLLINLFYGCIYFFIGTRSLAGVIAHSPFENFAEAFFFSTETFTTVGYGRVNPVGLLSNAVAALESLSGFMFFAVTTGLIYGRFARPRAFIAFSSQALMSPYQDATALMFRMVSYKDKHHLTNAEVDVTLGLMLEEKGTLVYKFYTLALERSRINLLSMNWTVVHKIDENSPLLGFSEKDLENAEAEIYVTVRGYDDVFSSVVLQRTSYLYNEIRFGAKFVPMYRESGQTTILELHKLDQYEDVDISVKR